MKDRRQKAAAREGERRSIEVFFVFKMLESRQGGKSRIEVTGEQS